MIDALKNRLVVVVKNSLALIVETDLVHQVYLVKVKRHKLVLTVFAVIALKKAVMLVHQKVRTRVLGTQTPTLHVALDAESSE